MLLQFSIENYLSFKDEAILSFIGNKSTKEHESQNVTVWNDLKILKSAVVYGANASGKSNLFSGIGYMRRIVSDSFKDAISDDTPISEKKSRSFQLNPKTKEESSFFEVVFVQNNVQYRYGFEINKSDIESEWLYYVPNKIETKLFYREGQDIQINATKFKEGHKLESKTRENVLFLSVCAQFNGEISNSIIDWFKDINIISGVEDRSFGGYTTNKIKKGKQFSKWVNKFINFLEISKLSVEEENISNINIDELDIPDEKKEIKDVLIAIHNLQKKQKTKSTLKSWHKVYNDNKILVDTVAFDFHMESKGTQKLIYLLGPIYDSLKNGKILLIDELDSRLHSILTKNLLNIFHDGNKNNAQFLFALHDPSSMENDSFRRDQIYLIEKDQYGASSLYSLLDYKKVRNDEKFSKNYLKGSYGAVPYINSFTNLMAEVYGKE
ncbi:MAG: AAA15 family ATPase/GTPase [Halioglobus sp.]|jgi:AAA15 family ATPase/GTPase